MAFDELTITAGNSVVRIAPERGGIVTSLVVGGRETLFLDRETLDDPERGVRGGMPVLFPFAGRLTEDLFDQTGTVIEQHGFAKRKKWRVAEHTPSMLRLSLDRDSETRAIYPFQYSTEMTFFAIPGGVHIELLVMNHGGAPLPISPGWHPYFICPHARKADVRGDMDQMPPGEIQDERTFDFGLEAPITGRIEFHIPALGDLRMSSSPEMRHIQFWSLPRRNFICIEPFFGPHNALNHPEQRLDLAPHASRMFFTRLEFRNIEPAPEELGGISSGEEHPWTVFASEVIMHRAPDTTSEPLGMLHAGNTVVGRPADGANGEPWLEVTRDGVQGFITLTAVHRVHPTNLLPATPALPLGGEVVSRWWGVPLAYTPEDLEPIPPIYTLQDDKDYQLRHPVREALVRLLENARIDGLEILVASAYRSGEEQRDIYASALARHGNAQRLSAPPGHSEHQLGTTVDFCDGARTEVFTPGFADTAEGKWLVTHAPRMGWVQTYRTDNSAETGYEVEPWHWRYVGQKS